MSHTDRIAKITKAYVRHYSDNGQTTAYVEWLDESGHAGRTEGEADYAWGPISSHMHALFKRAEREGLTIAWQKW